MIMDSFGLYLVKTGHDHETSPAGAGRSALMIDRRRGAPAVAGATSDY
jgi:hypothetical protein